MSCLVTLLNSGTHICSPLYSLILPLRLQPYTDGRSWARRPGYHRHGGVREGEELTDEEDQDV